MDVVVVDIGSRFFRAGKADPFPNEQEPWVVTAAEASVQDPNNPAQAAANGASSGDGSGGSGAAAALAGRVVHPVVKGTIKDWDVLEGCLDHVLYDRIGWQRGKEGGMLLAEPNFLSRDERERLCQLLFEVFNLSGYYAADQAVLSLYALGRLSGTVVDIGYGKIDVIPVLEGLAHPSTAVRLPYGTQQLAELLGKQLAARGISLGSVSSGGGGVSSSSSSSSSCVSFSAAAGLEELTRSIVRVLGTAEDAASGAGVEASTHVLPDGQSITIEREGVQLGEALMDASHLGLDLPRLPDAVFTAATAQGDKDTRKAWLENMLLCGGGSTVPGAGARLLRDMRALAPETLSPGLCGVPEYMPEGTLRHAAWMGGAVLARVSFSQAGGFLTKADYDESGPAAVLKKCV